MLSFAEADLTCAPSVAGLFRTSSWSDSPPIPLPSPGVRSSANSRDTHRLHVLLISTSQKVSGVCRERDMSSWSSSAPSSSLSLSLTVCLSPLDGLSQFNAGVDADGRRQRGGDSTYSKRGARMKKNTVEII